MYEGIVWHARGKGLSWPGDASVSNALGLTTTQVSDAITKLWELDRISIEFQSQRRLIHLAKPNNNRAYAPLLFKEIVVSSSSSINSSSREVSSSEALLLQLIAKVEQLEETVRQLRGKPLVVEEFPAVAQAREVTAQAIEWGEKSGKPILNVSGFYATALAEGWTTNVEPAGVMQQHDKARQAGEAVERRAAERAANRALAARKDAYWMGLGDDGQALLHEEADAELREAGHHPENEGRLWPGFLRAKREEIVTRRLATAA